MTSRIDQVHYGQVNSKHDARFLKLRKENFSSLSERVHGLVPDNIDIDVICDEFNASVRAEIDEIVALRDAGQNIIPEVMFSQLCSRGFTAQQAELVKRRGCVVVRGSFAESEANRWNRELGDYLHTNNYYTELREAIDAGDADRASHPHMLDIYWSKSQIEIRQSSRLRTLQQQLNGLWRVKSHGLGAFNPNSSYSYADRIRIREPGDKFNGLQPHVDNSSMESWFSRDGIARMYGTLLNGCWRQFDAFNAVDRVYTDRKPHPESCGVFRSYQGWMALTPQGADCGTLQLVPSSRCVAWMFLNMLQSSLNNNDQVFPKPIEAYLLHADKHDMLIRGLCSIPRLRAGDTVWWHPDTVHAVEQNNNASIPSSVVYLGIAPDCERNRQYMRSQLANFKQGLSPPDFPACDVEQHYQGRATETHLSVLGAQQMGHSTVAETAD